MRIVMIGDASVGKTTFMMSTYGLMHDGEIEGFKVRCKNKQADRKLMEAYNNFRATGKYPPPTVKMSSYDYDFFSNDDWVMNFTLTDIIGESIHDYDVNELYNMLKKADAVMLFLNAYDLAKGVDIQDSLDDILILLNNGFIGDDRMRMIMVIFSQIDRVEVLDQDCLNQIYDSVSELKEMAEKNDNILFQIVPTACSLDCMMDLDFSMVSLMLIGYSVNVQERYKALERERKSIGEQYGEGIWRTIKHAFGMDPQRERALERYKELEKEIDKYKGMIAKFEKLEKFYDDYEIGTAYSINKSGSGAQDDLFNL